jgi:hypothetical protein
MSICYPTDTDWSCRYTADEIIEIRNDPELQPNLEVAEAFAWSLLASLTAYQIGVCPVTIRPCATACAPSGSIPYAIAGGRSSGLGTGAIGMLNPYISGGRWYNACSCSRGGCGCTSLPTVKLPGPVGKITEVWLDGTLLAPDTYRVDDGFMLVRTDGEDWPACQDLAADDHAGFSVTYYRGAAPNAMTRRAAGVLANEFLLACDKDDACRLPSNVTRASRGGESYEFDRTDFPDGDTNIPEVNAIIRIYNPYGAKAPTTIASPDSLGIGGRMPSWRR